MKFKSLTRSQRKDQVWLQVAFDISTLATCARRKVGCVILDAQGRIISTGYNGVAPGQEHCTENPCEGAGQPSGKGLELCQAIHAEQNALSYCRTPENVHTVYCTDSPCIHCVKMLATTSAKRIVFARPYTHSTSEHYWRGRGGLWDHVEMPTVRCWAVNCNWDTIIKLPPATDFNPGQLALDLGT